MNEHDQNEAGAVVHVYESVADPHVDPILKNTEPAHLPVVRQLVIVAVFLVCMLGTGYTNALLSLFAPDRALSTVIAERVPVTIPKPLINPFDTVKLSADAAFVWDIRTQRPLFTKNSDTPLPLASVTKLMTSLVAYELLPDETTIPITIDAIRTDGDSGLRDGEKLSVEDLRDMVLIASSNDGAVALGSAAARSVETSVNAQKLFVDAMNLRARELGLTDTTFANPTGLDISTDTAGAYASARDVALLLEFILEHYPELVKHTTKTATRVYNTDGAYHDVANTNASVANIEGILASKTGYTELAGGNLVIAFDAALNRPIVVVVLGSTFDGRFSDVETLAQAARTYVSASPE